jgi:hypothetical protein
MRALVGLFVLALGCAAAPPRPRVLGDVDRARDSATAKQAAQSAPQALAHAEDMRRRAEAAHAAGDMASAQVLGEVALAAYEHAAVLSRLAQAEVRRGDAEARLARAEEELKALDDQERRVRADTEDLELRARVITDTLPLAENAPATPEREKARLEAARSLALQARLLCASARLLEPGRATLAPLTSELTTLDAKLSAKGPAPIDDAIALRSRCLAELGQIRRPTTLREPARGVENTLLAELSGADYQPARDERGVVVTLRRAFARDGKLSPPAASTLQALGRVAGTHKEFPVLVVLHKARAGSAGRDQPSLDTVLASLKQAGATRIEGAWAGDAAPVVEPGRPEANERNERVEVVFVAPSSG